MVPPKVFRVWSASCEDRYSAAIVFRTESICTLLPVDDATTGWDKGNRKATDDNVVAVPEIHEWGQITGPVRLNFSVPNKSFYLKSVFRANFSTSISGGKSIGPETRHTQMMLYNNNPLHIPPKYAHAQKHLSPPYESNHDFFEQITVSVC